ncbi:MAG: inositol monophosphatase [Proteobacteria bacterium]|nr:inositol monophosphatase [Pseudomonadota bacterium]
MLWLEAAGEAARAAGALVREAFGKVSHYTAKGRSVDLVTEVDRAAEACIARYLERRFPDHGLLAEEGTRRPSAPGQPLWVVDPLDGTTNFAHALPAVAVSIGIVQDDRVVAGAIYDPLRDELFSAARGLGARLNDRPLTVSTTPTLERSLVASGFPYDRRERAAYYLAFWQAVLPRVQGLRRLGAAAIDLAWVAAGRFDAYWELNLKPWDLAAGTLIVAEAGGRVTDHTGAAVVLDAGNIVASNGLVHEELLAALRSVRE